METDDFLKDDFLKEFMKRLPEDAPSDEFVGKVMREIIPAPQTESLKISWSSILKSAWPFVLITSAVILFLFTSDLPFGDALPGKGFFTIYLAPYLDIFTGSFRALFEKAGNLTLPLMIAVAAILFFSVDKILTVKRISHQPTP
ncbi:MAG: hypothetical protein ACM3N9_03960 [Syntrophothermus sp.]